MKVTSDSTRFSVFKYLKSDATTKRVRFKKMYFVLYFKDYYKTII